MMRLIIKCLITLSLLTMTACNYGRPVYVTATPEVTPQPPPKYSKLPFQIRVECSYDPNVRAAHTIVWELPGLAPEIAADDIANYQGSSGPPRGKVGKRIGDLAPCTIVTVNRFEWSAYDKIFYLYVDNENIRGWIRDERIEVL